MTTLLTMFRFVKKNRWIPSLHLLVVALWILVGPVLAGFSHNEVRHPQGVSVITDFAGDDLQRIAGGKEFSKELNVETEVEDSSESEMDAHGIPTLGDAHLRCDLLAVSLSARHAAPAPSGAKFPHPKVLYLENEVFRI